MCGRYAEEHVTFSTIAYGCCQQNLQINFEDNCFLCIWIDDESNTEDDRTIKVYRFMDENREIYIIIFGQDRRLL